jgi:hypothetical protein
VLYRSHTAPAPAEHVAAGGSKWDTIKPIRRWFSRPQRVLLFDDDAFKALPGEESNMVQVGGRCAAVVARLTEGRMMAGSSPPGCVATRRAVVLGQQLGLSRPC